MNSWRCPPVTPSNSSCTGVAALLPVRARHSRASHAFAVARGVRLGAHIYLIMQLDPLRVGHVAFT